MGLIGVGWRVLRRGGRGNPLSLSLARLTRRQGPRAEVILERVGAELRGTCRGRAVCVSLRADGVPVMSVAVEQTALDELMSYVRFVATISRPPTAVGGLLPPRMRAWYDVVVANPERGLSASNGMLVCEMGPAFLNDLAPGLSAGVSLAEALTDLPPLRKALADYLERREWAFRLEALRYLARAPGDELGREALEGCLGDDYPLHRAWAMVGLGPGRFPPAALDAMLIEGLAEGWSPGDEQLALVADFGGLATVPALRALESRVAGARRPAIQAAIGAIHSRARGGGPGALALHDGGGSPEGAVTLSTAGELDLIERTE